MIFPVRVATKTPSFLAPSEFSEYLVQGIEGVFLWLAIFCSDTVRKSNNVTDFHFAKYRLSFRKLQIFISQSIRTVSQIFPGQDDVLEIKRQNVQCSLFVVCIVLNLLRFLLPIVHDQWCKY